MAWYACGASMPEISAGMLGERVPEHYLKGNVTSEREYDAPATEQAKALEDVCEHCCRSRF